MDSIIKDNDVVEKIWVSLEEYYELWKKGEICDAKTIIGLSHLNYKAIKQFGGN